MTVKLALPTGDPRPLVTGLLERAGIAATGYEPGSRLLRSVVEDEGYTLRVFRERDIPIQVALGNYDLGICGDLWLAEMQTRFPTQHVVRIGTLPGPRTQVWVCAAPESGLREGALPAGATLAGARIASELPNLADLFAIHHRIPGYQLLTIAGSPDAYPPEDAELVLMAVAAPEEVRARGLVPVTCLFDGGLALIANADALVARPIGGLIARLAPMLTGTEPALEVRHGTGVGPMVTSRRNPDVVRLAVPDGHAQRHAPAALAAAGFVFDGYSESAYQRRPSSGIAGLEVKVLRPQDMPQLVAMGVFDVALSGRDLLFEHHARFPFSPVTMAIDLGTNRYRIGPVVDQPFPAETTAEAVKIWSRLGRPVRIASEFPGTAERFALDWLLTNTRIIPVAGASEGFVPEDADCLIEGVETGSSLRANKLKMLDTYMESTSCVLVRSEPVTTRLALLEDIVDRLRQSVVAAVQ
jgi:ATP phosphoribosyltransferase